MKNGVLFSILYFNFCSSIKVDVELRNMNVVLCLSFFAFLDAMLNIGFWKVHGLKDHKLDDEDFQSCAYNSDIIGFAETLGESSGNLPEYISPLS